MKTKMILVYMTCKDLAEAKNISETLLKAKLVKCTNMFPIKSMYWWEGKIKEGEEFVIIAKTLKNKFKAIKETVEKMHSYTIPCIISVDAEANEKFLNYLKIYKQKQTFKYKQSTI